MQFAMEANGYKITEKKLRLISAKKYVEVTGDAVFNWTNDGLSKIAESSKGAYLIEVGKTIQAAYKKALAKIMKTIQGLIDAVEKKMIGMEEAFKKRHAKTPPSGKDVEKAVNSMNSFKDAELRKIQDQVQTLYQDEIGKLTKPAHLAGCKKIQEGAKLKKSNGKLAWTIIKFVVVATAIAFATVATVATAGAAAPLLAATIVAGVALVAKSASLVISTAKDITAWAKQYRSNVAIAADEITNAEKAVAKALKAVEAANKNHEAMTLKVGEVKQEFLTAISKLDGDKSGDKKIQDARKKLEAGKSDLLKFEKQLGGHHPAEVLASLKKAREDLLKAQPRKAADLDTTNRWADFFKNAADVASNAVKAF